MDHRQAVQVLQANHTSKQTQLRLDVLSRVLYSGKCRDYPVAVVSITGTTQSGKSLLLNHILGHFAPEQVPVDKDGRLVGFEWRKSQTGVTTGIWMWPEPFIVRTTSGKDVAVILMDMEGFDNPKNDKQINRHLLTLSCLVSSVQIFNIKEKILKPDLDSLSLVAEFGSLAAASSNKQPFKRLVFLIRDWIYEGTGFSGGAPVMRKMFAELKEDAARLTSAFASLETFVMQSPGSRMHKPAFRGTPSECSTEFVAEFQELIRIIHDIEPLQRNGSDFNGSDLLQVFRDFPEFAPTSDPSSVIEATARSELQRLTKSCLQAYASKLVPLKDRLQKMTEDEVDQTHAAIAGEVVRELEKAAVIGSQDLKTQAVAELEERLSFLLQSLKDELYQSKNEALVRVDQQIDAIIKSYTDSLMKEIGKEGCFSDEDLQTVQMQHERILNSEFEKLARSLGEQEKEYADRRYEVKLQLKRDDIALANAKCRQELRERLGQVIQNQVSLFRQKAQHVAQNGLSKDEVTATLVSNKSRIVTQFRRDVRQKAISDELNQALDQAIDKEIQIALKDLDQVLLKKAEEKAEEEHHILQAAKEREIQELKESILREKDQMSQEYDQKQAQLLRMEQEWNKQKEDAERKFQKEKADREREFQERMRESEEQAERMAQDLQRVMQENAAQANLLMQQMAARPDRSGGFFDSIFNGVASIANAGANVVGAFKKGKSGKKR